MLEAKQLSWDNYVKCNPRPDASSDKAINTFLSQGADEEVMPTISKGGLLEGCPLPMSMFFLLLQVRHEGWFRHG